MLLLLAGVGPIRSANLLTALALLLLEHQMMEGRFELLRVGCCRRRQQPRMMTVLVNVLELLLLLVLEMMLLRCGSRARPVCLGRREGLRVVLCRRDGRIMLTRGTVLLCLVQKACEQRIHAVLSGPCCCLLNVMAAIPGGGDLRRQRRRRRRISSPTWLHAT